jgi:hypothetical protein
MAEPTKLVLASVGEDYVVAPDAILQAHKGRLSHVVIIGIDEKTGELVLAASHGPNYSLWLVEKAKKDFLV